VKYQYAIGTTQGGTDTVSWTDEIGACITRSGLALSDNTDYYFAVKATNTSGVESAAGTSDGITVVSFSNGWDDSTNTITTSAVNGTSCVYTFDERYRLRRVEYKDSGGVLIPGAAVYYAVNSVGNRTEMWFDDFLSTSGRTLYDYDFAGRLTSVTYPGQNALTYTLDWVGNRISGGWQYDDADRLVGPGSYTYSGSGNLLTSPSPAPTYTYDDKDLLSVVE
jgi:YD repeat-containing protein